MKRVYKLAIIGVVLWFELLFVLLHNPYPHGPIVDVPYRQNQRMAAYSAYTREPSPVTKVAFDNELARMQAYVRIRMAVLLGLLAAVNGLGIWYFLGSGTPKPTAQPGA